MFNISLSHICRYRKYIDHLVYLLINVLRSFFNYYKYNRIQKHGKNNQLYLIKTTVRV